MAKYKTKFELRDLPGAKGAQNGKVIILPDRIIFKTITGTNHYLNPKSIELFARNILKSLGKK